MKVILYMATTINGFIAKKDDSVEWSEDEGNAYYSKVSEIGNLITGRRTFPLYRKSDFVHMGNPTVVVLTSKIQKNGNKVKYANTPRKALEILEDNGFSTALVCGGSKTNSSFFQENLIDEIYLDIEPLVYGEGIPLFFENQTNLKLEFIESRFINKNTIQLHYKVFK